MSRLRIKGKCAKTGCGKIARKKFSFGLMPVGGVVEHVFRYCSLTHLREAKRTVEKRRVK